MNATRRFPNGLVRAVTCCAVGLLLACTVSVDSEGETQAGALIDRLPSGATAIAWVDFEALYETVTEAQWEEYEGMLQDEEGREDLERFEEATGIDLRRDLRQMGLAMMPGDADNDQPMVLLEAAFDRDRIESLLVDADSVEYQGVTLFALDDFFRNLEVAVGRDEADSPEPEVEIEGTPDDDAYIAVLDDSTLAIGTERGLQVILDVDAGRRDTLKSDTAMNDLISEVAGHGQFWLVATKPTWDEQVSDLGAAGAGAMVPAGAIESLETITLSMRIGSGLSLRLAGIAGTPDDARMLTDSLNGLLSMGKMMLQGSEPELFEMLDRGVRARQDGRRINIEADLTQADLDLLQRMAEEQQAGQVIGDAQ